MLNIYSKALLGFALFFVHFSSNASYTLSRETVRFVFLFHDKLASEIELRSSLSSRISTSLSQENCISSEAIKRISSKLNNPRDIISEISKYIEKKCPPLQITENELVLKNRFENYNLYVLFSSELSRNVESSFGHIRLAFMPDNNYMFSPSFTFSAYNFYSSNNKETDLMKYLKAAVSSVEGRYTKDYFFDNYYETVIEESRDIHRFKVNISQPEVNYLYEKLLSLIDKPSKYNFFLKNCSSESLRFITSTSNFSESFFIEASPPSKQLRELLDNNIISYTNSFSTKNNRKVNTLITEYNLDSIIYDNLSVVSLGNNYKFGITYYKSPRRKESSDHTFSYTEIMKLEANFEDDINSVTLIDKYQASSIYKGKVSLKLKIGYNIDNQLYLGVGHNNNNIGFDTMIGYSDSLAWSSLSKLNFKYKLIDLAIGYQTNTIENSKFIDAYYTPIERVSISISSKDNSKDISFNYAF
jgi:hypothetical protein